MGNNSVIEFWKTNENPITCYKSSKKKEVEKKKYNKNKVSIINKEGNEKQYNNVTEAAKAINVNKFVVYDILNGRLKNNTGLIIHKNNIK